MRVSINKYTSVIPCKTKDISGPFRFLLDLWDGATKVKRVYEEGELRETFFQPPEGYTYRQFIANGVNMEELKYNKPSKKVIFMVHGGSFLYRMSESFTRMIPFYAEAGGNVTVVAVDYRVAPEVSYREMIEDVVKGYEWLLLEGYKPEDIVVAGDSSGGGTSLASMIYLREHNYPLPAGIITLSACTNMGCSTISVSTKFDVDVVFGQSDLLNHNVNKFLGDADYRNPYVSPFYGSYHDFPPMLIQVGGDEMLLDDSKVIAKKAYSQGVDVTFEIYEKMFHDFQNCKGILLEADYAWKRIRKFLHRIFYNEVYK
ncbi:alpha/beta hydrolase [[Clostridium] polysaccharolyticum]|uniref:Acetyl esterase/lipase n=1 Tax=[Clostridium] polysaccharolyticum TaxID=29364 RepID=A0A1I0C8E3_9FIRM|nr:alpha/beta hydrolase fold domain-containing protein [[Clostridium] polysaccharolyticum]SET15358.1 Acetyl esterase/lipase [[Clostridium] polysaccharolyticum]